MITHTPRTEPTVSASPSTSRQSLNQPRSPITPNRYRAAPPINQSLPWTTSSRRSPVVERVEAESPSHSSTSNWQASIELSLTTRRRLIRKPLPQLPSPQINKADQAHDAEGQWVDSAALDAQFQKADSWWPEALPQKHTPASSSSSSQSNPSARTPISHDGHGLDEQSLRHLLTILHYAALRYDSKAASAYDDDTIRGNPVVSASGTYKKPSTSNTASSPTSSANNAEQGIYKLDEATLDSLYRALQTAFQHLSQKHLLGALQRTASIRWRAEAQLRNATAAQAVESNSGLSSRWARFAWPAAALGKAYKEAQRNVLPPLPGESAFSGLASPSHFQTTQDHYAALYADPDHRIRKRDVAVKILSNAVWFVRNYGPVAGVETLQEPHNGSDGKDPVDGLAPPPLSSSRRTSENLLKKNAGLPNFLPKSSATTAISGTATPDSSRSDVPRAPATPALPALEASSLPTSATPAIPTSVQDFTAVTASLFTQQLSRSPSVSTLDHVPSSTLPDNSQRSAPSSETATPSAPAPAPAPASADVNTGEKSKAMKHLASLSAAAGAAMRQKAQHAATTAAANGTKPEDSVDAVLAASAALRPQSSRPSLRSFASQAEAAETDALERAEREHLAKIGQGCDEWAKMVVCRLCASISVADAPDNKRRRRSGTITARDFNKVTATAQEADIGSSISTRSDMTAKAGKVDHVLPNNEAQKNADPHIEEQEIGSIAWKADLYDGDELFAHHCASSHDRRSNVSPHDEDERVRLVGGSFVCRVQTEEQKQTLVELLELALYVGMSMLLESSFLSDSDAARPKILKVPARTTSTIDAPQQGASLVHQPSPSRSNSQQSLDSRPRSVSGASSTLHTSNYAVSTRQADEPLHEADFAVAKFGPRNWTKSLWGKIGQLPLASAEPTANFFADRPSTSDGHATSTNAPRTSLTMQRYHTESVANGSPSTATRKALFKAGEEPKQSIAARKAALFANTPNHSAPSSPSAGRVATADPTVHSNNKAHGLVGRLMSAFTRPSSSDPSRVDTAVSDSEASVTSQASAAGGSQVILNDHDPTSRFRAPKILDRMTNFQKLRLQPKPRLAFPLESPSPAALSSSPELSMLLCYQYRMDPNQATFPTSAYLAAFHRLQLLRFLADQRRDHLTFASPSHGISASGDLLPFVGVQTLSSSSAWSAILLRGQQQPQHQPDERKGTRPVQLVSYELLSSSGSAPGLCREEVAFYQRLSNSRDVPLGQVIEELGIRACALEADGDVAAKAAHDSRVVSGKSHIGVTKDRSDAAAGQRINSAYDTPEQRLQFIHGCCRIKIVATVLPSRLYENQAEVLTQRDTDSDAEQNLQSATLSSPLLPTRSRESDVSAIAAASHTDKEAANTAFAVAETAVQVAESGTTRPLVDQRGSASASGIWMWNASAQSGWQSKAMPMSESTYLLSFARYLEAISYHPALRRAAGLEPASAKGYGGLITVQQQLRKGKNEDSRSIAEGPNLLRFFRSGRSLVKVQVQPLVLYDLHIEGPCLKTSGERRRERKQKQVQAEKRRFKQIAEQTRLEIQRFFASVKSNTSKLEDVVVSRDLDEAGKTIRRKSTAQQAETPGIFSNSSSAMMSEQVAEPLSLLTNLLSSLRSDEFELYEALQRTFFLDGINDVRKAFVDRAKSAKNRLTAWTKKHLSKKEQTDFETSPYDEPEYFDAGRRVFPGSCFIIRDDEPLSIIAYSLSSRDFRAEMGTLADRPQDTAGYTGSRNDEHVKQWRSAVMDGSEAKSNGSYLSTSTASTATAASMLLTDRSMRKVPLAQLDPDKDEVFYDAEPVRAVLKRKKRGRESSILSLTLRRVGSTISESQGAGYQAMTANGRPPSSAGSIKEPEDDDDDDSDDGDDDNMDEIRTDGRSSTTLSSTGGQDTTLNPQRTPLRRPSAAHLDRATPSPAWPGLHSPGSVSALRRTFELRSQSSFSSIPDRKSSIQLQRPGQSTGTSTISNASTDLTFQAQVLPISGRPASLASIFSSEKPDSTAADSRFSGVATRVHGTAASPGHPRSASKSRRPSSLVSDTSRDVDNVKLFSGTSPAAKNGRNTHRLGPQPASTGEGVANTDTQSFVSNSTLPGSQAAESPHIKHNLVHSSTKISCVSWFAEEFAALRERWGVEHDYVQSLSRCQPWIATGGKSKSAFFKTADERFIAKQLLTVWSIDEKEAFLEFAPAYIRYMMNSAINDCPTLLVKIAGVYSIKIKDIKTGETKLKMNVMLLENLWAGDGGKSIRFDLKGIRDRKVKLSAQQQQDLQQASTNAAVNGQPLVDVSGGAKGSTVQASATTAMNSGVMSAALDESESSGTGAASAGGASSGGSQWSSSQTGEARAGTGEPKPASSSSSSSAVWWDSEWIERYRQRAFVPETQKELFLRALQNDTHFLTASNVMDYSLLLGVMERPIRQDDMYPSAAPDAAEAANADEAPERPSFRCRIVDFLGAFTLAKQLESSSKKALKGQEAKGNVTILPPGEYASRFLSAMDSYFIGTPCQPRMDAQYGFDGMCAEVAGGQAGAVQGGGSGSDAGVRRPRLASVL